MNFADSADLLVLPWRRTWTWQIRHWLRTWGTTWNHDAGDWSPNHSPTRPDRGGRERERRGETADETEEPNNTAREGRGDLQVHIARGANCCVMRASAALNARRRDRDREGGIDSSSQLHRVTRQDQDQHPPTHLHTHTVLEINRGWQADMWINSAAGGRFKLVKEAAAHRQDTTITDGTFRAFLKYFTFTRDQIQEMQHPTASWEQP